MECKLLSEFEKDQIVTYNHHRQSLSDIGKKFNHHQLMFSEKNYKKTGNYHQKEGGGCKRKTTESESNGYRINWS